ncbi:putative F-box protein [Cardamine amara subsp. amara]|uniref:F-box protein n=1 Tax=Cardamine amara subsp. amara TaxID=228776 RepID=A0ABD1B0N6_CARAN
MEQQEEKKMKTYKRRRQSSSMSNSNSYFPNDLASEILLKLPTKSIVRFRSVSKLWSSITTDPYFINSFKTRDSRKPSLLLLFRRMDKLFAFSLPQHHQNSNEWSDYSSQPLDSYQMKLSHDYFCFSLTESVGGLICFQTLARPIIWNPSMRQFTLQENSRKTDGISDGPVSVGNFRR